MQEKAQEGKVVEVWNAALGESGVAQVDVARGWSELLARKDEAAITKARKAAFLAAGAMRNFAVPELESASQRPLPTGLLWLIGKRACQAPASFARLSSPTLMRVRLGKAATEALGML